MGRVLVFFNLRNAWSGPTDKTSLRTFVALESVTCIIEKKVCLCLLDETQAACDYSDADDGEPTSRMLHLGREKKGNRVFAFERCFCFATLLRRSRRLLELQQLASWLRCMVCVSSPCLPDQT